MVPAAKVLHLEMSAFFGRLNLASETKEEQIRIFFLGDENENENEEQNRMEQLSTDAINFFSSLMVQTNKQTRLFTPSKLCLSSLTYESNFCQSGKVLHLSRLLSYQQTLDLTNKCCVLLALSISNEEKKVLQNFLQIASVICQTGHIPYYPLNFFLRLIL